MNYNLTARFGGKLTGVCTGVVSIGEPGSYLPSLFVQKIYFVAHNVGLNRSYFERERERIYFVAHNVGLNRSYLERERESHTLTIAERDRQTDRQTDRENSNSLREREGGFTLLLITLV